MIETRDIRVDYGELTAVRDVSLSIGPGEIYGLIGPNGAGKSSLIRILATLRKPTYGDAVIAGHDVLDDVAAARARIGYMPDLAPVHEDLKCREFLDFFAAAHFIDRRDRRRRIEECLELVKLSDKAEAMAGTLSRGMTQRLVLAKTMLHDPSVLFLDEPASGIDPIARIDLRNLLRFLGDQGKTILVSSHILNELNDYCTSVGIMKTGNLRVSGRIEDVVSAADDLAGGTRLWELTAIGEGAVDRAREILIGLPNVESAAARGRVIEVEMQGDDQDAAEMLAAVVSEGIAVAGFTERRRGVEDLMMSVGGREGEA